MLSPPWDSSNSPSIMGTHHKTEQATLRYGILHWTTGGTEASQKGMVVEANPLSDNEHYHTHKHSSMVWWELVGYFRSAVHVAPVVLNHRPQGIEHGNLRTEGECQHLQNMPHKWLFISHHTPYHTHRTHTSIADPTSTFLEYLWTNKHSRIRLTKCPA